MAPSCPTAAACGSMLHHSRPHLHACGVQLDCDAALALKVHAVQVLRLQARESKVTHIPKEVLCKLRTTRADAAAHNAAGTEPGMHARGVGPRSSSTAAAAAAAARRRPWRQQQTRHEVMTSWLQSWSRLAGLEQTVAGQRAPTCMSRFSTVSVLISSWSARVDLPAWGAERRQHKSAQRKCVASGHSPPAAAATAALLQLLCM